jgi:hypothetical protein
MVSHHAGRARINPKSAAIRFRLLFFDTSKKGDVDVGDYQDLIRLIHQATVEIAGEYQRLHKRAKEDPGTAGYQGEQNWADILHKWLPTTFHVATKGRIIFSSGQTSDQVDVLVLSPSYPKGLLNKKVYLAAGVLAAFECKNTLRREHVRKAVRTSAKLGHLSRADRSVKQHIIYGLLAHSHDIASKRNPPGEVISVALKVADEAELNDPRNCLDFICVPISEPGRLCECLWPRRIHLASPLSLLATWPR